jgi:hypothetical protein
MTTSKDLTISRKDISVTDYNYRGTIDEVRIYNSELPLNYIKTLPSQWDLSTGLDFISANNELKVFPNPIEEYFYVMMGDKNMQVTIQLFSLQNQLIFIQKDVVPQQKLSISGIASGIYLLKATTKEGKQFTKKIIKL